jgi:predicted translin family RNA/ssDNA-binding protein
VTTCSDGRLTTLTPIPVAAAINNDIAAVHEQLISGVQKLAEKASVEPYYKWNGTWSRAMQDTILVELLHTWVLKERLLTPQDLSAIFKVPVGAVTEDKFHLSTEEYLLALVSLIEELSRLARNAVTVGDYQRPLAISKFVKDIHAGFQTLNLKNDILRKRSDGIKYRLKDVEDVVYDLSLRNLLPK